MVSKMFPKSPQSLQSPPEVGRLCAGLTVLWGQQASTRFQRPSSAPGPGMPIRSDIIEAIGHTPLIKLRRASEATGCTILGKAEFMNPGGSVKDRAGRQMI